VNFRLPAVVLICIPCLLRASDYRLQTLEQAHSLFRAATNETMFAEAAQQYEYLVTQEGLRNGPLFYNIGNSWFMAGDMGRAILNYRRAEQYLPEDADLRYNLAAARAMRSDLIPEKEPSQLIRTLLGWHLHTSTALRWWIFTAAWIPFWIFLFRARQTRRKDVRMTAAGAGALSILLLISLFTEILMKQQADPGVIIAPEVLARKGDGEQYAPAFQESLHSGTEFRGLETRGSWRHIRLADGQTCWIPSRAAESVHADSTEPFSRVD
jgi:tetratricopeptide (TPR) repeat protein